MTLVSDTALIAADVAKLHSIVHGAAGSTTSTDGGPVPSLASIIAGMRSAAILSATQGRPRFAIYYNRLETIANLNSVDKAARYIADNFDTMVLHYGLDNPASPGNAECAQIIAQVLAVRPEFEFFGYVHTGTTVQPSFTVAELNATTDRWLAMGCVGCFFDECEFAFGTSRQRLNSVLDHIHNRTTLGGKVAVAMVNGWDHSELYYDTVDATNNPTGEAVRFIAGDAVHHESLAFNSEQTAYKGADNSALGSVGIIHAWFLQQHEEVTRLLRKRFGLRYFACNTYDPADSDEQIARAFAVCQVVAKIIGADGVCLTVKDFGASGAGIYQCPSFTYDADYHRFVSSQPLIEWAGDSQSVKRGSLRFFSQFGRQWWTVPKHATLTSNIQRTIISLTADAVLFIPFKKGTVPFQARLMPFGNSSPSNVKIRMVGVCWDGSGVAWNDGQTQATNFTASGDSTVRIGRVF